MGPAENVAEKWGLAPEIAEKWGLAPFSICGPIFYMQVYDFFVGA